MDVEFYPPETDRIEYTPMPTTWMNEGRWHDDTPAPGGGTQWWQNDAKVAEMSDERWEKGIAEHARHIWPVPMLSPPPGHRDCKVPQRIIEKLRLTELFTETGMRRRQ